MASTSTSVASQPVAFTTQTPYPLPPQKFMIPGSWRRYQLSQLVNKALSLTNPVPFDFLIRGEILRTSLGEWCADNGVGEEESLEIEYIESIMPPQRMSDIPHQEWVASVSCQHKGLFLTGAYDGHVRLFNSSKEVKFDGPIHAAPITSSEDTRHMIASASHDLTAQITQVDFSAEAPRPFLSRFQSAGSHLLTSSWDGLLGLWDTSIPSTDEVPEPTLNDRERKKRRKVAGSERPRRKAPLLVLKSHTARVSRAVFSPVGNKAHSCGFDSTIRTWDTENGLCTDTITASEKPFLDLATTSDGNSILATSTDRSMTLYDVRVTSLASTASATFTHPATPSCVAVGSADHQVITGLTTASTKSAMASFKAWDGQQKVLSVDWSHGIAGIGGESGLEVWKINEA
ncbi:WD40-repeat-containing domain protein [Infundibulicybe gibba]|nr:WD40-repeat-containing domain protein [Infundibulicybe gibba]